MKKSKKEKIDKLKEIDKEVRKSFGKFYIFSIVIIIFLLLFPLIMKKVKIWFDIFLLILLLVFYIYMVRDLFKEKNNYWTALTSIFIFIFIIIMTLDIIKLGFFLIK